MTSYTTAHSLPTYDKTDLIADGIDNLRTKINAVSTATDTALTKEGARAEEAAKTYAAGITAANSGRLVTLESGESAQTNKLSDHDARLGNVETLAGLAPGDVSDATVATLLNNPASNSSQSLSQDYGRDDIDYVAQLAQNSPYTRLAIKRVEANDALEVTCYSPSGLHITHYVEGSAPSSGRDDYRIVGDVWSGQAGMVAKQYADLVLTGTFVATADQYGYTTQVGATWETTVAVPFAGAQVRVYPYRDNRGGVWRYTLGGHQVDYSTWAASGGQDTNGALVSADGVAAGTHKLRAEFLGADPLNAPVGGGPARGWIARTPSGSFHADQYSLVKLPDAAGWPKTTIVGRESNREFAWWLRPAGSTAAAEWVPYHGIASAVLAEPPIMYDGARVLDPVRLAVGESRALVGPFKLVQHVYGRHSSTGATNLLEIWTTHTIHSDGRLTVEGRIKVLSAVEVTNTYVIMNPVNGAVFDTVVTSFNNQYPNTAQQEGNNTFLPESDAAKSYLFVSSANTDLGAAFRYNNPSDTVRRGGAGKNPSGTRAWLEHRVGGAILKHYQKLWASNTVLPAGTVHRFSGDYIHVNSPQLFQQLSL